MLARPLPLRESPTSQSPASSARYPVPALIVLDKDGTLIDYHAMWSGWVEGLAERLAVGAARPLTADYLTYVGYDAAVRRTQPGGRLAVHDMATFYAHTVQFVQALGVAQPARVVAEAWSVPDPIHTAHPVTDLAVLFTALQALGCRLTVATSDDHAPAVDTLTHLGVIHYLEAILGADDGVPIKPLPDMVLAHCRTTGLAPARTAVVGDSLDDMHMAQAAGALAIGVLTGITPAAQLATVADVVLDTVAQLPALFDQKSLPAGQP